MTTADYQALLPTLPDQPGVYMYYDATGEIIYVGKAKNLKKRIASYFGDKKHQMHKTRLMIRAATHLSFTLTDSEHDAFLLENTLIKKHRPRYNISFKDDKTYSYICIKKEPFPRVFFTRRIIRDGSTYLGPFTSKHRVNIILDLIRQLFPLRTCPYQLTKTNIEAGKFKVCLEYHIKNCMGPCAGYESPEVYDARIAQIKNILSGNFSAVKKYLVAQMETYVDALAFEKAHDIKLKLDAFEDYQSKSVVVNPALRDVDVFTIALDQQQAWVHYMKIINGTIMTAITQEVTRKLDESIEELLPHAIQYLRDRYDSIAPEIIVPLKIDWPDSDVQITVPSRGDKKKLLDMSLNNVTYHVEQKKMQAANKTQKLTPSMRIMTALKEALHMSQLPVHIECFDNSNIQGTHPVSSCVVFRNARPSKSEYRHYKVKTVVGPDDFASMAEVIRRRYTRLIAEAKSLPQLIVIDGGKGQLSAAVDQLKQLGIYHQVSVIGIAKRLEEIYFPDDPLPLYINKKSEALKVIQQARNEAHRFAINFHRQLRSKNFIRTTLTDIPGIGAKTAEKLIKAFGSVERLAQATPTEWREVAGTSIEKKLNAFFNDVEQE